MKAESRSSPGVGTRLSTAHSEELAGAVLGQLAQDPDRLGTFLIATGLDPGRIRVAARDPGFLPAVLDFVAADEGLLVAIADEIGVRPERIMAARQVLSPKAEG